MPSLKDGITLPDEIELLDRQRGTSQRARIEDLTRDIAKEQMDLTWWSEVAAVPQDIRRAERDVGWKWVGLTGQLRQFGRNGYAWAVMTDDGKCQGAILYQLGAVSALDPSKPTVYCWRLASAPRNRDRLVANPRYRGVGTGLIKLASLHSYRAGLGGRVTLEAYNDSPTVAWYTRLGFQEARHVPTDIIEMELNPETAGTLLADLLVQL
ncbi:MAG TPA: GNAT family N-acetyltransferase [Urbifossiella sp.]|nr:GNAT family N-acetyltransferase [Urbifossiella sp.]